MNKFEAHGVTNFKEMGVDYLANERNNMHSDLMYKYTKTPAKPDL